MQPDYAALGFKAGLEIHQQLDTRKLFCRCPSALDESSDVVLLRTLRPTASELGEIDRAALEEARKELVFEYYAGRGSTCLVELDEEPPHALTPEAVEVALTTALLLKARPVDEVHVMRKIVIDGSNTSGFQRTAMLALDGHVDSSLGPVGIATLCLEEDSARKMERKGNLVQYRLDRLGIPLVEIATTPDIKGPEHAREVAEAIGLALRATGRVKRGIGTIRQDLNISIREGARIEIKGVQELRIIPIAVEYEVKRQAALVALRDALAERGGPALHAEIAAEKLHDVSTLFAATEAKMVKSALAAKGVVLALALDGFAGLIGRKEETKPNEVPKPRFGRELADYAKVKAGVKGIFHADELPAYGITEDEVHKVRAALGLGERDAFVLVAAPRAQAERALEGVRERAMLAFAGVPEETREVQDDGSSQYLRPLPGGARMYPETDVPPFLVTPAVLRAIKLPELLPQKLERWAREYADVSEDQRRQIARSAEAALFERLAKTTGMAKEAARLLLNTLPELAREGVSVEKLPEDALADAFAAMKEGKFAKEALPAVLRQMATKGGRAADAVAALGLGAGADVGAIAAEIDAIIAERADFVRERKDAAVGPLMGPVMAKHKGRISGDALSKLVKERIAAFLAR